MHDLQQPRYRRASATAEDLAARRQGNTPTSTRNTEEDESVCVTPRSSLRHRPIGNMYIIPFTDGSEMHVTERELDTLPQNYQNAAKLLTPQSAAPRQKRQPHPKLPVQDDTVYEMPPVRTHPQGTDALPKQKRHSFRFSWLFWVGVALFIMIAGYLLFNIVGNWWQVTQDDWHYGYPRTYQIDYNVGHGSAQDPNSHFIAVNLHRHIEVIEAPGDDPGKQLVYIGPTLIGQGEDLTPVTLSFEGGTKQHPNMIIHVQDSKFIFLNQQVKGVWKFVPAPNQ